MRVIHVHRHLYGIQSRGYSQTLVNCGRMTPGMAWRDEYRAWCGYADAVETCVAHLEEAGIEVDDKGALPEVKRPAEMMLANIAYANAHDYQREGIRWLVAHMGEGAILADDMGLGKSLQALRAARALKLPTLIVCPSHVRGVWGDSESSEVKKWWPEAWPPRMLSGTKTAPLPDAAAPLVTVCHYDILHAHAHELRQYVRTVILDEAHYCASSKARRTLAAASVCEVAPYRAALTGTPMTNKTKDFWSVVNTISPGRFGELRPGIGLPIPLGYAIRYCDARREQVTKDRTAWIYSGSSNLDELHSRTERFMLRRTKADVKLQLPSRTRQIIDLEIPRKFAVNPAAAIVGGKLNTAALRRGLDVAADGKIPGVIDYAADHLEQGNSIVVFAHRRVVAEEIADALAVKGHFARHSHGGLALKKRQERMDECRATAKVQPVAFVATIDTTSTGISLTFASVAMFAELTWEWWELAQAEARLHRPGQSENTLIQYFIARGSVDELIRRSLLIKLSTFETAIGSTGDNLSNDLRGAQQASSAAVLKSMFNMIMKGVSK